MKKEDKSLLLAVAIGDGSVYVRIMKKILKKTNELKEYSCVTFSMVHCTAQKEYLEWKVRRLNSILNTNLKVMEYDSDCFGKTYGKVRVSNSHKYWRLVYRQLYQNKRKTLTDRILNYLTPEGLAIWYMDDGYLVKHSNCNCYELYISTCTTLEENKIIAKYFKEKWDIDFSFHFDKRMNVGYQYSLRAITKEARKFLEIVKPYVSQVNCMSNKIADIKIQTSIAA